MNGRFAVIAHLLDHGFHRPGGPEQRRSRTSGSVGRTAVAVVTLAAILASFSGAAAVGRGRGIAQPTDIVLTLSGDGVTRSYDLVEGQRRTGNITAVRQTLVDADGNEVGNVAARCISAKRVLWTMDAVLTLEAGPDTQAGSIVASGLFDGFNGETLAVTGGTGAYENARGSAALSVEDGAFTWTLHLIP